MARAVLKGAALAPGIAIGKLKILPDSRIYEKRQVGEEEIAAEIHALQKASRQVCAKLQKTIASIPENLAEYREIVALQIELARDTRILNGAIGRIRRKKVCASWALSETIAELATLFQSMADPYLSDRAQDIRSIGQALMAALTGASPPADDSQPGVLAAYDLSPANIMDFRPRGNMGLMTVEGGATSHTAILARGLKVPAIGALNDLFREARNGETVILDGLAGEALLGPDENELSRYGALQKRYVAFETEARQAARLPAITRDGVEVTVLANLESAQETHELLRCGAEGVGLFRTEFGWMRESGEESLYREYCAVLKEARGKKVVFRTLDVGADKALPANEALREPNPALGLRGIRFCLSRENIFRPQLRALLRAAAQGDLSIMLPMIATLDEIRRFRELMAETARELERENLPHAANPPVGIMVETPAAVLICEELAAECDFLSLGTNDLLHYIMAIDRNNRHVSYLHDPLHPAFVRAISHVANACRAAGKKVSVCGELATDPSGIALLVGLGIDILSAAPQFVPTIKHCLRKLDAGGCKKIAALALEGKAETRALLRQTFTDCMDVEYFSRNSII